MQYKDLIQFDPIESVVELRSADKRERAESLVRNYVISEAMAERLTDVVFPQLQFRKPADNKGLMVVGNYGTGKSHLMAVLSAVAEHEGAVEALTNARVAEAASSIAGQFQVIRTELGSTQMRLRDFVCRELEAALAERGVTYQFPAYDQVGNHKGAFEDMMRAFEEAHRDQGLLLVVDELLDYLRTRTSQDLTLDLNFLREVGEVCRETRFRFITGLQETLFDNPAFEFAASAVQRVTARFEQVIIAKQDVKYVVAERLLKKTPEQRGHVRDYLRPFASSYARMNERLEEYVELFPVHPDYVDTFALIHFVEQRQVLKTLSAEMRERMDEAVPTDRPGVIAYDSYWARIVQDASLKSDPDVGEVIKVHDVLRSRVEQAFTRPEYAPMALRIIDALAVHRLTTRDVHAPIGPTAAELRDGLCLYDPVVADLGGDPAEDLLSQVETVLQEILKTVSGQFISYNRDNRQYYLDLKKTEDFDAIIDRRAETMGAAELDRAYYDALRQVIGTADRPTYNNLHNIWEHEVTWLDRKAGREGYLFFGTPNERNTAIPPKDFYLYFVQPFAAPRFNDEERKDEVVFRLRERDDAFEGALRRYAAAVAQAATASAQARAVYRQKAEQSLKTLARWLSDHLMTAFEVTHEGRTKKVPEWLKGINIREALGYGPQQAASGTIADHVSLVGSVALAPHFEASAPEYPRFSVLMPARRRAAVAGDALRVIRGARTNKEATAVLDALELLDGDKFAPHGSRYARWVLEKLEEKGHGQVLNRSELITSVYGVEYAEPGRYRLEPEWLVVVLAALVHNGDLVLAVPGGKFSATDLEALAMTSVDDLAAFKHVERPKDWNVPALRALFDLVGIPAGEVNDLTQGKEGPVRKLEQQAEALAGRLAEAQQKLLQGIQLWGKSLLTDGEAKAYAARMAEAKSFLESIQRYNTPGKLKNFKASAIDVAAHEAGLQALRTVERLAKLAQGLGPLAQYLAQAEIVLPETHAWTAEMRALRGEVLAELERPEARDDAGLEARLRTKLDAAKARYVKAYTALLREARLDLVQDRRKAEILHGPRVQALEALRAIPILPAGQLDQTKRALADLKATSTPGPDDLKHQPVFEGFQPVQEREEGTAAERLDKLDAQLDRLVDGWTAALLEALAQPTTRERMALLDPEQRALLDDFQEKGALPDPPSPAFVAAVQEALKQLKGVPVKRDTLVERLFAGGAPATPDQLRERLDAFLREIADGTDASKVRILLES